MPAAREYPGIYIEEIPSGGRAIEGVPTSITAFVGRTPRGPSTTPWTVSSRSEFENDFGRPGVANSLEPGVGDFFANGGKQALIVRVSKDDGSPEGLPPDEASYKAAFDALRKTDIFNLLCLPPDSAAGDVDAAVLQGALELCVDRRSLLIVDPRSDWSAPADVLDANRGLAALRLSGDAARNAAVFFPHTEKTDPSRRGRVAAFAPCGAIAGVMARTDAQRGVWKAPAGLEARLKNIQGLSVSLTDSENGELNSSGVNCLRSFPGSGPVVWGARTLRGTDALNDEYKYVPVRRLALFLEESLYRGTRWAVFESNDEPTWALIRSTVGTFLHSLFRQGAFQGSTPSDAYFVKCDAETMTPLDRQLGIVNITVGFAPLKPAEFVVIELRHRAGSGRP
jgi:phage tail sheath protein FI